MSGFPFGGGGPGSLNMSDPNALIEAGAKAYLSRDRGISLGPFILG